MVRKECDQLTKGLDHVLLQVGPRLSQEHPPKKQP